jgi:hypothetical protein
MPSNDSQQVDNRMQWIRALERAKTLPGDERYLEEYEIVSECEIHRRLWYEDGFITSWWLGKNSYMDGLNSYGLRLTLGTADRMQFTEDGKPIIRASNDGYFSRSLEDELISLLSLWLHSRFYFVHCTTGEVTDRSISHRWGKKFVHRPCQNAEQRRSWLFSRKKKDMYSVQAVLDAARRLDPLFHHAFYSAASQYADGLRWVGVEDEMVYIRLVSSVETLSAFEGIEGDELAGKVEAWIQAAGDSLLDKEKHELHSWLKQRKAKAKFVQFLCTHSQGFFQEHPSEQEGLWITQDSLPDYLKKIYDARSAYLHTGKPMWICEEMSYQDAIGRGWDLDRSISMIIDQRRIDGSEKIPTALFFDALVRHCLLNFLGIHPLKRY